MQLLQFAFKTIAQPSLLQCHSAIVIAGKQYPAVFTQWWFDQIKKSSLSLFAIDCTQLSLQEAQAQLLTACLGFSFVYILRSLHEVDEKTKQCWFSFVRHYQGPHTLIVFCQEELESCKDDKWFCLTVSDTINKDQFGTLCDGFFSETDAVRLKSQFVPYLFINKHEISFDFACLIAWYGLLIGNQIESFFSSWFPLLYTHDYSLFTLSQYFFAQQPQPFFNAWYQLKDIYPLAFWISFWSDQLWRAYSYLLFMNQKQLPLARKSGHKLPFSFVQRDWKKHSVLFIQQLHNYLYELDYRFKQGLTADLELFYCRMLYKK